VTEDDLRNIFQPHGEIINLFMKRGEKGTFAFVTYCSLEEANKGLE
jgi:RNA recognition motif-containing protein